MRFVEEKGKFRLIHIADFGQTLEQLGQHPQQKRAIQTRRLHQFIRRHDIHHAFTGNGLHHIVDIEHRLAEKLIAALAL